MDLFGFKRRRAAKEANARRRAAATENAIRVTQERPAFPPRGARPLAEVSEYPYSSPRRHRPEADAPDSIYPHGSASGMTVDNNYASWAQPDTSGHGHSYGSHDFGAAGSGLGFDSGSSSSSSDSGSSSSDSGGSYGGE